VNAGNSFVRRGEQPCNRLHPEGQLKSFPHLLTTSTTEVYNRGAEMLQLSVALQILGLDVCADTLVGDDMRRGISGGQKKRVTTGTVRDQLTQRMLIIRLVLINYPY
jgi:hypothetical protein